MNQKIGLFTSVNPNDTEGLRAKALVAAYWLKIISIISLVITAIFGVIAIFIGGAIGSMVGDSIGASAAGAGAMIAITIVILIIASAFTLLTLWYTGKVKQELENNVIPGLIFAYIMAAFAVIGIIGNIYPEFHLIPLVIQIFIAYLWYTLITSISNLSNNY